jgi:hypothetical protein
MGADQEQSVQPITSSPLKSNFDVFCRGGADVVMESILSHKMLCKGKGAGMDVRLLL